MYNNIQKSLWKKKNSAHSCEDKEESILYKSSLELIFVVYSWCKYPQSKVSKKDSVVWFLQCFLRNVQTHRISCVFNSVSYTSQEKMLNLWFNFMNQKKIICPQTLDCSACSLDLSFVGNKNRQVEIVSIKISTKTKSLLIYYIGAKLQKF